MNLTHLSVSMNMTVIPRCLLLTWLWSSTELTDNFAIPVKGIRTWHPRTGHFGINIILR